MNSFVYGISENIFEIDEQNRIKTHTDPRGTILTNVYDNDGRVIEQYEYNPEKDASPEDKRLIYTFAYSGSDSSVPESDHCTLLISYADTTTSEYICFNSDELRIFTQDSDGNTEYKERNEDGMVENIIDEMGNITSFVYDGLRRMTLQVFPDTQEWHSEIEYTYENNFNRVTEKKETVTSLVDSTVVERITTYQIDSSNGNVISITDPLLKTEYYSYDQYGNVLTHTDKNGNVTTYTYDPNGNYRLTESKVATLPDGNTQTIVKSYEYDVYGNRTKYTDPKDQVHVYDYDNQGNLWSVIDPYGNTKTYEYDIENHRTAMIDELGHRTNYVFDTDINASLTKEERVGVSGNITTQREYDDIGVLTKEIDANGNQTSYVYDDAGRVYQRIEPNNTTTYLYDARGNLAQETNLAGQKTTYHYDERNQLVETRRYLGTSVYVSEKNIYDGFGRIVETIDANNASSYREYDLNDRLKKEIDALGNTTEYFYDDLGNKIGELFPRAYVDINLRNISGHTNTYEYDEVGRMIKMINADDKITIYTYDENGRLKKVIDRQDSDGTNNTHTREYTYDKLGRKLTETDSYGETIIYTYDEVGNMLTRTDQMDRTTEYIYDDFDRLVEERDPAGYSTKHTYDDNGNKTSIEYPDGKIISYTYDESNRLTIVTDHLGNTREYTYDALGNKTSETDKLNNTSTFTYDKLNRLISETNAQQTTTNYTYDDSGNRTSEDVAGKITTFEYDDLNRIKKIIHPGYNNEQFNYDEEGNALAKIDGNGEINSYNYDKLNRIYQEDIALGHSIYFTYDNWDNIILTEDNIHGTASYIYDQENRPIEQQKYFYVLSPTYITSRTYHPDGQVDILTDSAGHVLYHNYDNRGLLDTITKDGITLADYDYNSMSLPSTLTYGNGTVTTYSYDDLHRVDILEIKNSSGEVLFKHDYDYDAESNRTQLVENDVRTINYDYDDLEQIINVNYGDIDGIGDIVFTYDKWGNRLTLDTPYGHTDYTYATDSNELVSKVENDRLYTYYTYDQNGSLTKEIHKRLGVDIRQVDYIWDKKNRLSQIVYKELNRPDYLPDVSDNRLRFLYDENDDRYHKLVNNGKGPATYYINDGLRVASELDGNGNATKNLVYGLEQVAEIDSSGKITYVHSDVLGSTVLLTDEDENVVAEYEYDVFGSIVGYGGSEKTDYLFTNQEFDPESELYYYNARYYNPSVGRFISRDVFMGRDGDTISRNRYVYVKNNPLRYVDPTGNEEEDVVLEEDLFGYPSTPKIVDESDIAQFSLGQIKKILLESSVDVIEDMSPNIRAKLAVTYFELKNYDFAAELLRYSYKKKGSVYEFGPNAWFGVKSKTLKKIKKSSEYQKNVVNPVKNGKLNNNGSFSFKSDKDLFYALHAVSFSSKSNLKKGWIWDSWEIDTTINDTYDFAFTSDPDGVLDKLVNMFYKDMINGDLKKFKVIIHVEDKISK